MRCNAYLTALLVILLAVPACHKTALSPPPAPAVAPPETQETNRSTETQRRPTKPATPSQTAPASPAQTPSATPQQPEFRLGQPLTPEEQRANNALIDQHLRHANQALASIGNRRLTQQQKSLIPQIRGFITQAQQVRRTDLAGARSLAEKADVLATDLLAQLK